jgi:hypothetical protein
MPVPSTILLSHARRARLGSSQPARRAHLAVAGRACFAVPDPGSRASSSEIREFAPPIDAHAAGQLLDLPHTWLLAQAREGCIPHHRLGHYVRFNPEDLQAWVKETRSMPHEGNFQARRRRS